MISMKFTRRRSLPKHSIPSARTRESNVRYAGRPQNDDEKCDKPGPSRSSTNFIVGLSKNSRPCLRSRILRLPSATRSRDGPLSRATSMIA